MCTPGLNLLAAQKQFGKKAFSSDLIEGVLLGSSIYVFISKVLITCFWIVPYEFGPLQFMNGYENMRVFLASNILNLIYFTVVVHKDLTEKLTYNSLSREKETLISGFALCENLVLGHWALDKSLSPVLVKINLCLQLLQDHLSIICSLHYVWSYSSFLKIVMIYLLMRKESILQTLQLRYLHTCALQHLCSFS